MRKRTHLAWMMFLLVPILGGASIARAQQNLIPVKVELVTRAVSKTPVLIAYDRGIYKKYGLDVQLWMPAGEFPGAIEIGGQRMDNPDFSVDGGVPMVSAIFANRGPKRLQIATTDCEIRFSIVGKKGLKSLEEIKGKRLGISNDGAMTGFIYRALAKRMGWTPGKDFIVVERAQRLDDLKAGKADAFIADDRYMALAKAEGYPVLADTSTWKQPIAGSGPVSTRHIVGGSWAYARGWCRSAARHIGAGERRRACRGGISRLSCSSRGCRPAGG